MKTIRDLSLVEFEVSQGILEKQVKVADLVRAKKLIELIDKLNIHRSLLKYSPEIDRLTDAVVYLSQISSVRFWLDNQENRSDGFLGYALSKLHPTSSFDEVNFEFLNFKFQKFIPSLVRTLQVDCSTEQAVAKLKSCCIVEESLNGLHTVKLQEAPDTNNMFRRITSLGNGDIPFNVSFGTDDPTYLIFVHYKNAADTDLSLYGRVETGVYFFRES